MAVSREQSAGVVGGCKYQPRCAGRKSAGDVEGTRGTADMCHRSQPYKAVRGRFRHDAETQNMREGTGAHLLCGSLHKLHR